MELQVGEVKLGSSHLFTGFVRDLTERQDRERRLAELQSELIHVSRLSDLGQMVSAIAHEVNQPLTAIANYIRGIRRLLTPENPPSLHEAIERVAAQAERAHRIVQGLRGLVKKEARPVQAENLETIVQETAALALSGTGRSVSLDLQIPPEAQDVEVDKVQIQQVLLNLIRNAAEALGSAPDGRIEIACARLADGTARVSVADNGPGLDPEVSGRLFEPFVSTKRDGMGIGLTICRTIVEGHGGRMAAEPREGGGTIFHVVLPGVRDSREQEALDAA
jgi:two-component system sensor kinase FixL